MGAKIYNVPKEVKVPELNFNNFNLRKYEEDIKIFKQELIKYLNDIGYKESYVGETISFPVGDGKAEYMVFNLKPVMLIHLPIGDAWEFPQAHLLTKTEVLKLITQRKAIEKLFNRKK